MATRTFSSEVKEELARVYPEKKCCALAELAAIARRNGTVTIGENGEIGFYFVSEQTSLARKVYRLMRELYADKMELTVKQQVGNRQRSRYMLRLNPCDETAAILQSMGILSSGKRIIPGIKKDLIRNKCCQRAYLRGAFLAGGSISSLERDYHMELSASNERFAKDLLALLNRFSGMHSKISRRKQSYIVYLKDSDQIADFLTIIEAHGHLLEYENARVYRSMKNQVKRNVNLETANLDKISHAAARQVNQITLIQERIGLDSLEPSLAQVARLRLENPDISLEELGEIITPPLGKSGVNHRLRKISEIAEKLNKNPV